jgi:hypothetical protein
VTDPPITDPHLVRWVRQQYHTVQIGRMELHHVGKGWGHVQSWNHEEFFRSGPRDMAREVYLAAVSDTQGAGFTGVQRYVLVCFEKEDPARPRRGISRCVFQVGAADEAPKTESGVIDQMRKQNEEFMRLCLQAYKHSEEREEAQQKTQARLALQMNLIEAHESKLKAEMIHYLASTIGAKKTKPKLSKSRKKTARRGSK